MHEILKFGRWEPDEDGNATMQCHGQQLAIKWNNSRGMYDGFINGKNVDMHTFGSPEGLHSLTSMLQHEARRVYEAETFKYKKGQRITSAKCDDNKLRGNGVIAHVRYMPDRGDREPAYLINFGGSLHHATESDINA